MADVRVTQLPAATGLQNTDVLHGVQTADGRDKHFTLLDLQGYVNAAGVTSVFGRTGAVIAVEGDYNLNLLGDVDLSVAPTNDQVLMFDGVNWSASNIPTSPVGGMAMHYRWSTDTLSTDPGSGFVKVNAADPHLATALFINDITSLGNDLSPVYDNIEPGDVIGVWEEAASNTTLYYEVTSATDNGGWHSFGVTNIPTAAGNINNNNHVEVFVVGNPARQLIPGGTTGQILTKTTGANYDVQWANPAVQSVYGRTGAIVAQNGDYDLGQMDDVNLTTNPPTTGQLLQFSGTYWEPVDPGTVGYWSRTGTVVSPTNAGDTISTTGQLLVGSSTARSNFYGVSWTAESQVEGTTDQSSSLSLVCTHPSNNQAGSLVLGASKGSGGIGSNGLTGSTQGLGLITFQGNNGTAMAEAARIAGVADGTPSATSMPGRIQFSTTPAGSTFATERARISSAGVFTLGNGTTNAVTLDPGTTGSPLVRDSAGRVGIGVSSPTHNLTIGSTAASDFVLSFRGGVGGFLGWDDSANCTILQAPNTRSLQFRVNSDTFSAGTMAMHINSSGNVGIGTTSAETTLRVNGTTSSPQQTITAGAFDLATGNFWTAGGITVPNPTNAVAGTSGLIVLTGAPTGWGTNFAFPGGTPPTVTTVPAVIPFYVQDPGTILMGAVIEGIS